MGGTSWLLLSPMLLAGVAAIAALIADAVATPRRAVATAAVVLGASAVLGAVVAATHRGTLVAGTLAVGGTFAALGAVCGGLGALALVAGSSRLGGQPHGGQTAALVAFSASASMVLVSAYDLAVFVIAIELIALVGYALVASARTPRAQEAAMKYFVQGAVATGLLAYGLAVLFGVFGGRLPFPQSAASLANAGPAAAVTTMLALFMAALAFKVGAFPFHSWAPDVYETAPAPVAAFLASAPKLAGLVAIVTLFDLVFSAQAAQWAPLAAALAVASIVFGNFAALRQVSLRRMLAYSGIAQVGYALVGVAAGVAVGPFVLLFAVAYALAAFGAFTAAEAAGEGDAWDGSIAALAGVGRRRPVLSASLAVCLMSLTGLPLTLGFWGKFWVFGGAVSQAAGAYAWLAVVGVLGSVVSFGYYGGVLRALYLDEAPAIPEGAEQPGRQAATGVVTAIAIALLAGGILPLFLARACSR